MTQLEDYTVECDYMQYISICCAKHGSFDVTDDGSWPTMRQVHHAIAQHEAAHHPLRAVVNQLEEKMKA